MPEALMVVLAHAGHWAIWLLYAIPVFAVLAVLIVGTVRERRRAEGGEDPSQGDDDGRGPGATPRPSAGP